TMRPAFHRGAGRTPPPPDRRGPPGRGRRRRPGRRVDPVVPGPADHRRALGDGSALERGLPADQPGPAHRRGMVARPGVGPAQPERSMIEATARLLRALHDAGLDLEPEELLDALWLARRLPAPPRARPDGVPPPSPA